MGSPARLSLHLQNGRFPTSPDIAVQVRRGGNGSKALSPGCHPSPSQFSWALVLATCGWLHPGAGCLSM